MGQIQSTSYNPPEAWRDTPPVERAAHLFESFLPGRAAELCAEEGICIHDIDAGAKLADAHERARTISCHIHGAPEYGDHHMGRTFSSAEVETLIRVFCRLHQRALEAYREGRQDDGDALARMAGTLEVRVLGGWHQGPLAYVPVGTVGEL